MLVDEYVYFITNKEQVKIGFSKDPHKRLKQIRTYIPDADLFYSAYNDTGYKIHEIEKMVQYSFYSHYVDREWFNFNGDVKEIIKFIEEKGLKIFMYSEIEVVIKPILPELYEKVWAGKLTMVKLFERFATYCILERQYTKEKNNVDK